MRIPYTYLITNLITGQRYYGVRYGRGSNPEDLWVKYFTSSEVVKNHIKKYGAENFRAEVRRVFDSPEKAYAWETKVLRRLNVVGKEEWLNKSCNSLHPEYKSIEVVCPFCDKEGSGPAMFRHHFGNCPENPENADRREELLAARKHKESSKEKMRKPKTITKPRPPVTEETRKKQSEIMKGKKYAVKQDSHIFQNVETGEIFEGTAYDLWLKGGIQRGNLTRMIQGKLNKTGGWRLVRN